jgi:hypothetical protein
MGANITSKVDALNKSILIRVKILSNIVSGGVGIIYSRKGAKAQRRDYFKSFRC